MQKAMRYALIVLFFPIWFPVYLFVKAIFGIFRIIPFLVCFLDGEDYKEAWEESDPFTWNWEW